jgi:GT2 family glycosyltransferase
MQTLRAYHLLLIDDGSTDGTSEYVKQSIDNCTVIQGKGSWWWAGSLQQGYKWLKINGGADDLVLIINDDVVIPSDYLEIGSELMGRKSKSLTYTICYSMQTKELFWSGIHIEWRAYSFSPNARKELVNCASTRGLFLRVKDFLEIGGFHPRLLPQYFSDYEFTYRAFRKGYTFDSSPNLNLLMDESSSGFRSMGSDGLFPFLKKYFSRKNPSNPLPQLMFVALACPWKYKIKNWFKITEGASSSIIKHVLNLWK